MLLARILMCAAASLIGSQAIPPSTVMIGDSITAAMPAGLCRGALNYGRPSATTRDLLTLTDAVFAARPQTIVIMAGVNDAGHQAKSHARPATTITTRMPKKQPPPAVITLSSGILDLCIDATIMERPTERSRTAESTSVRRSSYRCARPPHTTLPTQSPDISFR